MDIISKIHHSDHASTGDVDLMSGNSREAGCASQMSIIAFCWMGSKPIARNSILATNRQFEVACLLRKVNSSLQGWVESPFPRGKGFKDGSTTRCSVLHSMPKTQLQIHLHLQKLR